MDVTAVLSVLQIIVANLPGAIKTVEQLYDLGVKFMTAQNGTAPTEDEQATLRAMIDSDVAEALTPLPPAQPGDPDFVDPTT